MSLAEQGNSKNAEYFVDGLVFLDANQNGLFESYEYGIGGVKIKIPEVEPVITNEKGEFGIKFSTFREVEEISVDISSIPPGGIFTTPSKFQISKQLGSKRKFSFGIYYKQRKIVLGKQGAVDDSRLSTAEEGDKYKLEVKDNKLFINEKPQGAKISNTIMSYVKNEMGKTINIPFEEIPLSFSSKSHKEAVEYLKTVKQFLKPAVIKVTMEGDNFEDRARSVAEELWLSFLENGIKKENLKIVIEKGPKSCQVIVESYKADKDQCKVQISGQEIKLEKGSPTLLPYSKYPNVRGEVQCPTGVWIFDSPWKKSEEKQASVINANEVTLFTAPHLKYSQDLNVFFEIQSSAAELKVNSEAATKINNGNYAAVVKGKEGFNTLLLEESVGGTVTNKYNYEYPLFLGNRSNVKMTFKYLRKSSQSDEFNSNYVIPTLSQFNLEAKHILKKNRWQIHFGYTTDMKESEIESVVEEKINEGHIEYRLFAGKEFRFNPEAFSSSKYGLYAGLINKEFSPGSIATIFSGEVLTGLLLKADFSMDEVFAQAIDFMTSAELGFDFSFSNQMLRIQSEIHIWLNGLGKMFGKTPEYLYYERFGFFHDTKLVTGLSVEYNNLTTANASDSRTVDWYYSLYIGLDYSF